MSNPTVVMTIGGFDPTSGGGVSADLKTIAAHHCYGVGCVTALTVQSTAGVRRVEPVSAELVSQTLEELTADVRITAVRIGMLGSAEMAAVVADWLPKSGALSIVLDPVLISPTRTRLLDEDGIAVIKDRLLAQATVVTPNMLEAAALTGLEVQDLAGMKRAGRELLRQGAKAVVIKGGQLEGHETVDLLCEPEGWVELRGVRQSSESTHGTGCAFATALACNLASGQAVEWGAQNAKKYVQEAISRGYSIGRGPGPLHLLHTLETTTYY